LLKNEASKKETTFFLMTKTTMEKEAKSDGNKKGFRENKVVLCHSGN